MLLVSFEFLKAGGVQKGCVFFLPFFQLRVFWGSMQIAAYPFSNPEEFHCTVRKHGEPKTPDGCPCEPGHTLAPKSTMETTPGLRRAGGVQADGTVLFMWVSVTNTTPKWGGELCHPTAKGKGVLSKYFQLKRTADLGIHYAFLKVRLTPRVALPSRTPVRSLPQLHAQELLHLQLYSKKPVVVWMRLLMQDSLKP